MFAKATRARSNRLLISSGLFKMDADLRAWTERHPERSSVSDRVKSTSYLILENKATRAFASIFNDIAELSKCWTGLDKMKDGFMICLLFTH